MYSARSESTFTPTGIFPPACMAATSLAGSIGGDGLMVATSKLGLVWANDAIAASARQIVSFLNMDCTREAPFAGSIKIISYNWPENIELMAGFTIYRTVDDQFHSSGLKCSGEW
jgi:hypothetical protein